MNRPMKSTLLLGVATTIVSFAALPAFAQQADEDQAGIKEIVVTAQRREENLQDVSISISALTAEQMAERGTNDISRLEGQVPGFTFGRSGSDARPAIRGVPRARLAISRAPPSSAGAPSLRALRSTMMNSSSSL